MPKTILVKNITSLSEARYCSGMMVDFISFDLNPESADFVDLKEFEEIKNWLSGVKILGSYSTDDIFKIIEALNLYKLDGFIFEENQKSMLEDIDCATKFLEIENAENFESILNADFIILKDIKQKEIIEEWSKEYNVLIGYEFDNIDSQNQEIAGYAFKGSKEVRPGINNYDGLMEALEKLEDLN
jgi:phosphoribosylanthranilate isomerase